MEGSWWRVLTECGPLKKTIVNHSACLLWEYHEQYEKAKRYDAERWTPQVGRCPICTGNQWRNNARKNEEMEPKQKQHPVVDVTGDGNKLQPFLCLGMFPPYPLWRIFIINRCWILSKAFSASIEMILWFLSNLWKCYITLIDLWVWNHTCFPGMNPV